MMYDEEYRKKMSEVLKKRYERKPRKPYSAERRARIGAKSKEVGISPETRAKMVAARKRNGTYVFSEEHKRNLSIARRKRVVSEKTRLKTGESSKRVWQRPGMRDKMVRAIVRSIHIHPNKPETTLLGLLNLVQPGEWIYTGDGSLVLGGKNPDFRSIKSPLLCEMYGDYWHRNHPPKDRIQLFERFGFKTLIVWERELKHPLSVMDRIREFVGVGDRSPLVERAASLDLSSVRQKDRGGSKCKQPPSHSVSSVPLSRSRRLRNRGPDGGSWASPWGSSCSRYPSRYISSTKGAR